MPPDVPDSTSLEVLERLIQKVCARDKPKQYTVVVVCQENLLLLTRRYDKRNDAKKVEEIARTSIFLLRMMQCTSEILDPRYFTPFPQRPNMSTLQHVSLWSESPALPMMETKPSSQNTLIFVGGLTDTLATVPYLPMLAEAIAPLDFSLVQPQLSSSLGGFGLSSLEADAQELCILIEHLRNRQIDPKPKAGKIVIMGHSTGCQDIVHFLSRERQDCIIDGGILQAPMSDREDFEEKNRKGSEGFARLEHSKLLVEQGKGSTLLERHIDSPRKSSSQNAVNGAVFQEPAMTAYRYWSLNGKGGDDDYFSSDLSEERMKEIWSNSISRGHRILALLGEQE